MSFLETYKKKKKKKKRRERPSRNKVERGVP